MYIVQVHIKVKEKHIEPFINATLENAGNSLLEDGIIRFDILQDIEEPFEFLLTEIYLDKQASLEHKKTLHYQKWKTTVVEMMAEPRFSMKYRNIFPKIIEK